MREAEERTNKMINFLEEEKGLILGGAGKMRDSYLNFSRKLRMRRYALRKDMSEMLHEKTWGEAMTFTWSRCMGKGKGGGGGNNVGGAQLARRCRDVGVSCAGGESG